MVDRIVPNRPTSAQLKPETLIRLHSLANQLRSIRNRRVTLDEVINDALDAYEKDPDDFEFLDTNRKVSA